MRSLAMTSARASKHPCNLATVASFFVQSLWYRRHLPSLLALQQSIAAPIRASFTRARALPSTSALARAPDSKLRRTSVGKSQRFQRLPVVKVEYPSRGDLVWSCKARSTEAVALLNVSEGGLSNLVEETKRKNGFTSNARAWRPASAPVNATVPPPENGSNRISPGRTPSVSIARSTSFGEKPSLTKYHRCLGSASTPSVFDTP